MFFLTSRVYDVPLLLDPQVPTASVTIEGASALNRVRWSSGGKEVAVGDSEGRVFIYDTGEVRTLVTGSSSGSWCWVVAPPGKKHFATEIKTFFLRIATFFQKSMRHGGKMSFVLVAVCSVSDFKSRFCQRTQEGAQNYGDDYNMVITIIILAIIVQH